MIFEEGQSNWMGMMVMTRVKLRRLIKHLVQSVMSLSFNLGGLLAGILLALYFDAFSVNSWVLLLFPGVLSTRGAIGGVFSGRLSTALHTGRVNASFRNNTRTFHILFYAIIMLTLCSSIVMGVVTSLFSVFIVGTTMVDSIAILAVTTGTMGLSLVFISPITIAVSILSFKKGLDPDVIVYPVISTVADVLVTICYIFMLNSFFSSQPGRILIGMFGLAFSLIACYIVIKNYREPMFLKTVKEFFLTIILVAFIVNITGSALNRIGRIVGSKRKMYIVYPALIDTVGDVGSIVGSTATTKFALGLMGPSFSSVKQHLFEISSAWSASQIMFIIYAITASLVNGFAVSSGFWRFTVQLVATNLLAVPLIIIISFVVAISTQQRGLDPDNFVIPIESALADGITTISLLIVLIMAG